MSNISTRRLVILLAFAAIVMPATASALEVVDEGHIRLSIGGLATGGYALEMASGREADLGTYITYGRLSATSDHDGLGSAKVQADFESGAGELVDAVATLDALDPLRLRVGRFKTSATAEYNISGSKRLFVDRAILSSMAPRRATGVEATFGMSVGSADVSTELGIFMPPGASLRDELGQIVVSGTSLDFNSGLGFHVGFSEHILNPNERPVTGERIITNDRVLSGAVYYRDDSWWLHAEGLAVLDGPDDDTTPFAAYGFAGYRLNPEDSTVWELAIAYDFARRDQDVHRGTVALNTYLMDEKLMTTLEYRGTVRGIDHAVFGQLQVGF